ncbi:hypothetical protein GCM10025880_38650 [Methylorubrum aminovorans]|nr:hypothetical protein GCM10025880_38650 [Methylorubrum aminovorans]
MERVVIYGGTGGIGLATARALRARGVALHLVGRDAERLERAASDLGETGFTAGDVTDPTLFPRVANEAGARLGGLIYAVGTIQLAPLAKLDPARIEADFRINALGAFLAVQAAAPALKAGAGEGVRASCCSPPWPPRKDSRTTLRSPWPRERSRGSPSRSPPNSRPRSGSTWSPPR